MSKKLFDEENSFEDTEQEQDLDSVNVENPEGGETESEGEFQQFGRLAIDEDWLMNTNGEIRNAHESFEQKRLEENIYNIFVASPYNDVYDGNKKVHKNEMLNVYLYFLDRIEEPERYTASEKFIAIASFMKMNFEVMYRELPILYKEAIVKELNNKYHMISNKKAHNLF